jgi:hypothetical protein
MTLTIYLDDKSEFITVKINYKIKKWLLSEESKTSESIRR